MGTSCPGARDRLYPGPYKRAADSHCGVRSTRTIHWAQYEADRKKHSWLFTTTQTRSEWDHALAGPVRGTSTRRQTLPPASTTPINYFDPYGVEALTDYWSHNVLTDQELESRLDDDRRGLPPLSDGTAPQSK